MPRSHKKTRFNDIDRFQHRSTCWFAALFVFVLVSMPWLPVTVLAQTPAPHTISTNIDLTPEEQAWLKAHPRIVLGAPTDYPPMVIKRADGTHIGMLVDLFEQISRYLNTRIGLHIEDSWSDIQEKAQNREIDGLAFGGRDPSRDALYIATDIVTPTYFFVFGRSRVEYQIKSFSDLDGMRIGYKRAARPTRSLLEKLPSAILKPYDSHESMTQALLSREIDVIVAWMSYDHWRKGNMQGTIDNILLIDEYPIEMVSYVRSDWPELIPILNKTMAALQQDELPRIINKWFGQWPQSSPTPKVSLTPEEQAWLAEGHRIRVRISHLPPVMFIEPEIQGFSVDYLKAVASIIGVDFQFVPAQETWLKGFEDIGGERRNYDLEPAARRVPERLERYAMTDVYINEPWVIYSRDDVTDIQSMADLAGRRVAVERGFVIGQKLTADYPDIQLVHRDTSQKAIEALATEEVEAYIGGLIVPPYIIGQEGYGNIRVVGQTPYEPQGFSVAVREDWAPLASLIDKALKLVAKKRQGEFWHKWVPTVQGTSAKWIPDDESSPLDLSAEERAWLTQNNMVRVRIADWPPYQIIKDNELPQGIVIEYLRLIGERTGITFKNEVADQPFSEFLESMKQRQGPDMTPIIVPTAEREQYLSFSEPYLSSPYVIFVREEGETILDISALFGRTIAVPRGHVVQEQLERNYPKIRLALFDSDEEALQALSTAQADAYIGNLTVASHILQLRGLSNIKVAASTPFGDQSFSIGNRSDWPELTSIINKALASITEEEKTAIRNKYLAIQHEQGIDKAEALKWALIAGLAVATLFFVFLFWNRRLSREIRIREQAEEDLNLAKDDAVAANRAKSTFLANMSHELRTPLHAILGFSRLLARDSSVNKAQQEKLDIINHSGEHLLGMVDDILSLSKIEAGHIELKQEAFDFIHVLQDVSQMMKSRSEDKGLGFILELDLGLSPHVMGDAGKLRQVLINLLGNAVKFTEKGEVWLRARSQPMSVPDMALFQMEVQDTGPGIPKDRLDDVFESFVRADHTQVIESGTGLGLAISKSLIGMMNGEITIESEPGQGSLFKVNVPLQLVKAGAAMPSEAPMAEVIGLQEGQPSWRILVVDDNLENRVLLTTLLTRIGCNVKEAKNGEQAIKIFQEWRPHFIWMDMRMPVMDGFEATRKIRTLAGGESVRIVAVTASVLEERHNEMLVCGCDEVVLKPFIDNEIFESMARQLEIMYLFKDESTEAMQKQRINLTAEMLAELPPELRQKLGETTLVLNMEAILEVIEGISEHAPDAAESLRLMVQNFQIERIRELLGEVA